MNEEAIKHAFDLFVRDGYGGDINKFQKLLATNPRALEHSFKLFEKDGYKEGAEKYNLLMGLNQVPYAPQDNPIQIESAPAVEPITTAATTTPEPVKTEPAKELSNKQSETIKVRSIHQGESEMPVADGAKMPPMVVRKIETIAEEEPANKLPVSTGLTPITDKTEVKAIETPSDKMVIKSDKKVEEPVKAEEPKMEVKDVTKEEPKMVIKSDKKEEPMKVMTEKEKKEWQCPPAEGGCPKNKNVVHDYFNEKYKDKDYTPIIDREGNLAKFIDDGGRGVPITEYYGRKSYTHDSYGFTYSAEELPKSERFSVYNAQVDEKETSLIYDNKTGVIMKGTGDVITSEDGKQMKTWIDVPVNNPEYNTLKAEIDKAKSGTTAPKVSTVPTLEPWQQPQGNMQVKEVTEQPKAEVKAEEPKGIPSYKGIDKNTDIGGGVFTDKTKISSNLDAKELSPKEILDGDLLTKGWYNIELNRNVSSRYPDPPNVDVKKTIKSENVGVFKPIKIGEENYYTNYDKDSKKWHLYKEGSNDNEWKELKNGAIKSMLNSKLLNNNGEPIKEQIDYTEKDANEINLAKKKLAYSKYLQYLVNNFDDLTEKEQQQVKDVMQQDQYDKYYRWISQNVDDPKVIDFWIKALEKTNTDSYYLEEIKKKKAH